MKKVMSIVIGAWLITLAALWLMNSAQEKKPQRIYKVSSNRIQHQLSTDLEQNIDLLKSLSDEERDGIETIEIIDSDKSSQDEVKAFFEVNNVYKDFVVFIPIENTSFIVRFDLKPAKHNMQYQVIVLSVSVTLAYFFMIVYLLLININIIKPMERLSKITKQIATGYIGEIKLQCNKGYVKDFIWSLDMLREQLSYEKDKNAGLEKQRKTLVAGLSHDIRTPLSSIKNYTIALKEGVYEGYDDKNHALNVILEKTQVIERLTQELLESSMKAIGELVVQTKEVYLLKVHQQLNHIIHQKIDLLHIQYKAAHIGENVLLVVDLDRLSEVFDNIIENALKYGDMRSLSVDYSTEEDCELITISNTGVKISETEIKHIFTSYYRGSNVSDKPGYGLGLYRAKQIMKKMKGDLFARNTEGGVSLIIVIKKAGGL